MFPCSYEGDNFVLDGQIVRAALKSYNFLSSAPNHPLGSHAKYLRLLKGDAPGRPVISESTWQNSGAIVHLLEWRAALAIQNFAQTVDEADADINQRLAKAITEAFVATRVAEMIAGLRGLPEKEARVIGDLYHLVNSTLRIKIVLLKKEPPLFSIS
jgi:acyl-CoA oxidase